LDKYLMVGFGGFLGAIARFWLGDVVAQKMGTRFPYGTFVINISGCFVIGFIVTLLSEHTHLSASWRYLVAVGFIGAYTTFSTFEWETLAALRKGDFLIAGLNVALSVVLGFAAVWLGAFLAPHPQVRRVPVYHTVSQMAPDKQELELVPSGALEARADTDNDDNDGGIMTTEPA
jgi:fluoride exporter